MPYASNADLPESVRDAYSARCQTVFREAFNGAKGDEASHFAQAHTAAKNCMSSVAKAEWTSAYVNDLPDSAFACIDADGEKDEDGRTTPRSKRHYPHHGADGKVDEAHLRNALSRVAQAGTTSCGKDHLDAHASALGIGEPAEKRASFAVPARIVKNDATRQIAYSVVLEPRSAENPDSQGDWYIAEDIELAAHGFMSLVAKGASGSGLMHLGDELVGYPVESFIAPVDFTWGSDDRIELVKAGSWVVGMHYPDAAVWERVESGELGALSVQGRGVRLLEEAAA